MIKMVSVILTIITIRSYLNSNIPKHFYLMSDKTYIFSTTPHQLFYIYMIHYRSTHSCSQINIKLFKHRWILNNGGIFYHWRCTTTITAHLHTPTRCFLTIRVHSNHIILKWYYLCELEQVQPIQFEYNAFSGM